MRIFDFLFLLALAVFPFGQLPTLPFSLFGFPEVNLHLLDFLVFLMVLAFLGKWLLKKEKFPQTTLNKPIFLFTGIALFSLLVNTPFRVNLQGEPLLQGREVVVSFLYLLRFSLYVGLFWAVFNFCQKDKKRKNLILKGLILAGTTSAILGLLQYFFLPDIRPLSAFGWDPHLYRAVGSFLDPAFLGATLVLNLVLIAFVWKRANWWLFLAGILNYLCLALTYSRASYLGFLFAAGSLSHLKKNTKIFIGACLLLVITILILPRPGGEGVRLERESTIKARMINWQQSLEIFEKHPFFGVGFNSYRYAQRRYGFLGEEDWQTSHAGAGADSSLLFVLATTGIFGLLAYLWLWARVLKVSPLLFTSGGVLLVHSLFSNTLFYPWVVFWVWVLIGSTIKERR